MYAPTGYGNQTAQAAPRLIAGGHEVVLSAFYGLQGGQLTIDGVQVVAGALVNNSYGNEIIEAHAHWHDVDAVIGLLDIWVMDADVLTRLNNYYNWTPVDHYPLPPAVADRARAARGVIAMSRFGEAAFREAGFDPLYVPHGVDSSIYAPKDQAESRRKLGLPEGVFVVGMFMANKGAPSRKAFDQQIRAFAELLKHAPDSILYMHTEEKGMFGGEDLKRIMQMCGVPLDRVRWVPQYQYLTGMITGEMMADAYSACDVVMNATRGEGFGIPIVEAQMCGVPVIVTDFTAMPELCRTGWIVPGAEMVYTAQGSYQMIPSAEMLALALVQAWHHRGDVEMREKARRNVMAYDADAVYERYWIPALERIRKEIEAGKPASVEARREARRLKRQAARERKAAEETDKQARRDGMDAAISAPPVV